jgi:transposase InsO family protein
LRGKVVLELVHVHICDPMRTISISDTKYFLLFVDDLSRKMWVYFLKQKSNAFHEFKKFKSMVEKEFIRSVKILQIDNGREFWSNAFVETYNGKGIQHQYTTPYTPQ